MADPMVPTPERAQGVAFWGALREGRVTWNDWRATFEVDGEHDIPTPCRFVLRRFVGEIEIETFTAVVAAGAPMRVIRSGA